MTIEVQNSERLKEAMERAASRVHELRADNARLRAALQRLVTDYQDVPDPTDTDGQAVFEDARRALEPQAMTDLVERLRDMMQELYSVNGAAALLLDEALTEIERLTATDLIVEITATGRYRVRFTEDGKRLRLERMP